MSLTLYLPEYSKGSRDNRIQRWHRNARTTQSAFIFFDYVSTLNTKLSKFETIYTFGASKKQGTGYRPSQGWSNFSPFIPQKSKLKVSFENVPDERQKPQCSLKLIFFPAFPTHSLCFGQQWRWLTELQEPQQWERNWHHQLDLCSQHQDSRFLHQKAEN